MENFIPVLLIVAGILFGLWEAAFIVTKIKRAFRNGRNGESDEEWGPVDDL